MLCTKNVSRCFIDGNVVNLHELLDSSYFNSYVNDCGYSSDHADSMARSLVRRQELAQLVGSNEFYTDRTNDLEEHLRLRAFKDHAYSQSRRVTFAPGTIF